MTAVHPVIEAHAARIRAVDPLAGGQDGLPAPGPNEGAIEVVDGLGLTSVDRLDPGAMNATWSPLIVHRLWGRAGGRDPEAALGALLDQWLAGLGGERGPDKALAVQWPSRDTAAVRALTLRGFAPMVATAARVRGAAPSGPPAAASRVRMRAAVPADMAVVARLYEALVAYDAQFGWVTMRSSTRARIVESLAPVLRGEGSWCWVAEVDGAAAGIVMVEPPTLARWIAPAVRSAPVAYLSAMYADPAVRGQGVGAAMAAAAHTHIEAAGVATTVLHHAVPNPLSAPFWARQGYRPVLTQWVRHLPPR
ncbi:GNAT family N-acetyltransferase [Nonomuraea sp. NPDC049714]|uniref:GNAT family N-acetyltransferase n=1 Tax=Nonomuraea sp. NPDC049714 TaxID=3364357 RepID=UPI00379B0209